MAITIGAEVFVAEGIFVVEAGAVDCTVVGRAGCAAVVGAGAGSTMTGVCATAGAATGAASCAMAEVEVSAAIAAIAMGAQRVR